MNSQVREFFDYFPKARNLLFRSVRRIPTFNTFAGRSDSEATFYVASLKRALSNDKFLRNFRRPYNYREILEHVSYDLGVEYLNNVKRLEPNRWQDLLQVNSRNDFFGNPILYNFAAAGKFSPTTLRYISTALEMRNSIQLKKTDSIAEIGIGYGGQAAVIENLLQNKKYTFFDLPEAVQLSKTYLNRIGSKLNPVVGDLNSVQDEFDVVISNYAFSELSRDLQESYLSKVLQKSKRGYMIMNSGRTDFSGRSAGKISAEELLSRLKNSCIEEEVPKTGPDNYVLIWSN